MLANSRSLTSGSQINLDFESKSKSAVSQLPVVAISYVKFKRTMVEATSLGCFLFSACLIFGKLLSLTTCFSLVHLDFLYSNNINLMALK